MFYIFFLIWYVIAAQRQIGETLLNERSSRSHQIIKLVCPFSFTLLKLEHILHALFLLLTKSFCVFTVADNRKFCTWVLRQRQFNHPCSKCGIDKLFPIQSEVHNKTLPVGFIRRFQGTKLNCKCRLLKILKSVSVFICRIL